MMVAVAAQTAVRNFRRLAEALTEVEGLRYAMLAQAPVEQAEEILMAARVTSPERIEWHRARHSTL